jgi:hypothetical protein
VSATDSPSVNLRKALKKLGPVQVNLVQAEKGLLAEAEPVMQVCAIKRISALVRDIVALKGQIIREYEALGGTWDRPSS